jgi:hypothetical protein
MGLEEENARLRRLVERIGSCLHGLVIQMDDGSTDDAVGECCRMGVIEYMDFIGEA